jgi:hypothetical protein
MKKKKPIIKAGIAVQGKILPTWEIDFSSGIGDEPLDQWTRGPILPVGAEPPTVKNGKRGAKSRKRKA